MHRIEELYYESEGKCYVSFSGGKDSTVLLALIKLCEDIYTIPEGGIPAVFCSTGVELGETVRFVRWVKDTGWYSNVQIIRPQKSFDWVIKNKGKPMKSKMKSEYLARWHKGNRSRSVVMNLIEGKTNQGKRAQKLHIADKDVHLLSDDFPIRISNLCCNELKKKPFAKYAKEHGVKGYITGVRADEGGARQLSAQCRANENNGRICTAFHGGVTLKMPLIDWTDEILEEFIRKYNVPLSEAYTKYGFHRTGCMACPFSQQLTHDLKHLHDHDPSRYKASMHWLGDVFIAQDVRLPFDEAYEREREREWFSTYEPMRQEMLRKYRPHSRLIKHEQQISIFDVLNEEDK